VRHYDKKLFNKAAAYADNYLTSLDKRSVFPGNKAINNLSAFNEPMPLHSCKGDEILDMLHRYGSPATVAQNSGKYFGFVNGAALPDAVATSWLSSAWDQNAALYLMSPIASFLEKVCEKWLIELFDLPDTCVAGFVSGSSTATLCGLAAARQHLLSRLGWDINKKGLSGAPNIQIIVGEQSHSSVFKALAMLGYGMEQLEVVAADDQGRMRIDALPKINGQALIIAQAGNVYSGGFDPLPAISRLSQKTDSWLHIDGAFGMWCTCSTNLKHLTKGMEMADSWSVDAHKTLNAPYDCGIVLCRDPDALATAMQATASYIHYSDKRDPMMFVPEMSRRARSIELWAALKSLGREGIAQLVDQLHHLAITFAHSLQNRGFHIQNEVAFNQVLVACDDDAQTNATLSHVQNSGICWCGSAIWRNQPVIRISVCSYLTDEKDIEESVHAFVQARMAARQETSSSSRSSSCYTGQNNTAENKENPA
jgi:glutamate/tyrosine decarboxylase-like PLP-dependent enzyme